MGYSNKAETWFIRSIWLGIVVNLTFAIPALFFPKVFSAWLGLGEVVPTIWLQNAGLLLVLLCCFYALVARNPLAVLPFSYMTVAARFMAACFWLVLVLTGHPMVLIEFLCTDFLIGVLQGILLWRSL